MKDIHILVEDGELKKVEIERTLMKGPCNIHMANDKGEMKFIGTCDEVKTKEIVYESEPGELR